MCFNELFFSQEVEWSMITKLFDLKGVVFKLIINNFLVNFYVFVSSYETFYLLSAVTMEKLRLNSIGYKIFSLE